MQKIKISKRHMVVADAAMESTIELANRAARSAVPVLLLGESGTGKELLARYIHEKSLNASGEYVSVNCAAIPEGLLESELFGYEKGAFTGAVCARAGKFEQANRGTLLLDEISEMPIHLQAKLLRVLQEGEVDRLGGKSVAVSTRVISTTNRDPVEMVKHGKFRKDLFFRLNVMMICCPPLRGRREAICAFTKHFAELAAEREGREEIRLSPETMEKLTNYQWPGNVRELQNVVERAVLISDSGVVEPEHIQLFSSLDSTSCGESLYEVEKQQILKILSLTQGHRNEAARRLGITSRTLRNKIKEFGIS